MYYKTTTIIIHSFDSSFTCGIVRLPQVTSRATIHTDGEWLRRLIGDGGLKAAGERSLKKKESIIISLYLSHLHAEVS